MKGILGFGRREESDAKPRHEEQRESAVTPIKSLVQVRFPNISRCYAYYNDLFDLKKGDLVFVSGKLAGVCGIVVSVNHKFKIDLAAYQRVIAHPAVKLCGTYMPVLDKMVSVGHDAVSPDMFRGWIKPPSAEDTEVKFAIGDGYCFELNSFTDDDCVQGDVLQRALNCCGDGNVAYISLSNGIGTAFVEGTSWYEIEFKYRDGFVSDMYCECPYPEFCKHNIAVLLTLRELIKNIQSDNFTAIDKQFFFKMLAISGQSITL